MGARIKTVIVEDDNTLRAILSASLSADRRIELLASYRSGDAFLDAVDELDAEVVVMDIGMPGTNGVDCVRLAKPRKPSMQFLISTVFENPAIIFQALCAGATGYLVKSAPGVELTDAVCEIHRGGSPMTPAIARLVVASLHKEMAPSIRQTVLTEREQEVLDGLAAGLLYKQIADRHGVGINTVRTHVRSIYEKLQVHSRQEAIRVAFPDAR
ncbi:MAG TPA: response regulator transcription factor [Flavobacteriales bacterium]|nr:response regulator transcription factor [Flavobacteriales bacterium]HMR26134.1 response regulator transcription factor [Flavobacteriales bacterium]